MAAATVFAAAAALVVAVRADAAFSVATFAVAARTVLALAAAAFAVAVRAALARADSVPVAPLVAAAAEESTACDELGAAAGTSLAVEVVRERCAVP